MKVGLFIPCFVDGFHPDAGVATVAVLERLGVQPAYPAEQTCCGQPHYNAGHRREARELAARFVRLFDRFDTIVAPSGSCVAMVRNHYAELLGPTPVAERVFDLCEFLVDRLGREDVGARLPGRAVLHVGCHHRRELHAAPAAERLLDRVRGLERVRVASDDWCCGFGGVFAVKQPELSAAMGRRKLAPILAADPDFLVSTDSSCLLQLDGLLRKQGRRRPRTLHFAEVLAARGRID